ncbi:MAG: DUF3365 domain-containing protein [Bacteriovoracaceae bacterium]|jgi:hypothetical protein|nr:hypothetical protein [Halobacteriovoraceae bacterium]MDP7320761.1 DUF3365 domain-containing protein [Bacteriovoracaceae bacterium]|tara:strand:+ start:946 stop:1467 length:522 start_codon:yes stop_codon:yes gene_type:complete
MTKQILLFFALLLPSYGYASEELALKTIKTYAKSLKKELKAGLKKSPQEAIKICQIKAPQLQAESNLKNLKIGRVSLKNRNPKNTPRAWMKDYIQQFHNQKITKSHIVVSLDRHTKGLLKPIVTVPLCLKCHGSHLSEQVSKEIKKRYPQDKATGYKVGEIRGFFWAEYTEKD